MKDSFSLFFSISNSIKLTTSTLICSHYVMVTATFLLFSSSFVLLLFTLFAAFLSTPFSRFSNLFFGLFTTAYYVFFSLCWIKIGLFFLQLLFLVPPRSFYLQFFYNRCSHFFKDFLRFPFEGAEDLKSSAPSIGQNSFSLSQSPMSERFIFSIFLHFPISSNFPLLISIVSILFLLSNCFFFLSG